MPRLVCKGCKGHIFDVHAELFSKKFRKLLTRDIWHDIFVRTYYKCRRCGDAFYWDSKYSAEATSEFMEANALEVEQDAPTL